MHVLLGGGGGILADLDHVYVYTVYRYRHMYAPFVAGQKSRNGLIRHVSNGNAI